MVNNMPYSYIYTQPPLSIYICTNKMKEKIIRAIPFILIIFFALAFMKLYVNKRSGGKDDCFSLAVMPEDTMHGSLLYLFIMI